MPDLLEEQKNILGEDWSDGTVTLDHLKELPKLDSFIRESLRTSGRGIALPHKIVGMDEWKLPNGYILPKGLCIIAKPSVWPTYASELLIGTVININTEDVYFSPELQGPEPREFNAWRYAAVPRYNGLHISH